MVLKYTSKRPDEELDGLQDLEDHFTEGNPDDVVAIAIVSRHGITRVDPSPDWTATVRIKHIEPMAGEEAEKLRKQLREQYGRRTGNQVLPIDGDPDELDGV